MKIDILPNNWYLTLEDIEYERFGKKRIIKAGFYFNGGSLPRLLWFISHPLYMPYLYGFIIHDFEYSKKCNYQVQRKEADKFFKENCRKGKGSKFIEIQIMYLGVRIFGKSFFKKDLPFKKGETL